MTIRFNVGGLDVETADAETASKIIAAIARRRATPVTRNLRGWPLGEAHGRSVLTEEKVRAMRAEHAPGVRGKGIKAMSVKYGCAMATARDVLSYKTWPHIV